MNDPGGKTALKFLAYAFGFFVLTGSIYALTLLNYFYFTPIHIEW